MQRLDGRLLGGITLALGVGVSSLAATSPSTKRPCPSAEALSSGTRRPCKDGFFTRFEGSIRGMVSTLRVVEVDGDETYEQSYTALALPRGFDVTLGGTPHPGILVGGFLGYQYADYFDVRVKERGSADPGYTFRAEPRGEGLGRLRLGLALSYYPNPERGLVFDLRPTIGSVEAELPENFYYSTYGLEVGGGYELWFRPNLSMGVALRTEIARGRSAILYRQEQDYEEGWTHSTGLALTLTLH